MRNVIAAVMGIVIAFALVSLTDAVAGSLFRLPEGIDPNNRAAVTAALEAALAKAPLSAMLTLIAGYFVSAFGGGFIARKIAQDNALWPSLTVGVLLLLGTIGNYMMISHPLIMVILGVLAPVPGAWLGARVAAPRPR